MNKPMLHLDRLSPADLGKFSVLLSQLLNNRQRATLNTTIPDIMGQIGAFDLPRNLQPQGTNSSGLPVVGGLSQQDFEHVKAYLMNGRMIEAIKLVRNTCGIGLKEAKDYCDKLRASVNPPDAGHSNQQY